MAMRELRGGAMLIPIAAPLRVFLIIGIFLK
jgi:hypothetical protein